MDMRFEAIKRDLPDIFIYVIKKGNIFSYSRIKSPGSIKEELAYKDIKMKIEKAQNPKGQYMDSGMMNMRFALGTEAEISLLRARQPTELEQKDARQNGSTLEGWSQEPQGSSGRPQPLVIIANVYMGKDLICCDDNGLSDPVIFFDHHGATAKTSVFKNSLNPVWCERVVLQSAVYPGGWIPPLVAKVYDQDENLLTADEYEPIGLGKIPILPDQIKRGGNIEQLVNQIPDFEWYQIKDDSGTITAKIFMSVTVVLQENTSLSPAAISPLRFLRDKYNFKIHILGLRGLQSNGLFAVRQPMIKFHVGALRNGDKSKGGNPLDVLTARCKKGGSDPSFSELIT
jgi:C2 domain